MDGTTHRIRRASGPTESSRTVLVIAALLVAGAMAGPGMAGQQAKLLASDGLPNSDFGFAADIDGDTAIVGAGLHGVDGFPESGGYGAAYVYVRSSGVWTEQAKLSVEGARDFGGTVALDGDTALVGAPSDLIGGIESGSVYVFKRSGGIWSLEAQLLASDRESNDFFGQGLAIDGDTAVIGAFGGDDGGPVSGSAYAFTRSGTVWTEQAKLVPGDLDEWDLYGAFLDLDGDTAIIGSFLDDDNGDDSGSAYVFARSGEVWTEQAKLLPSDGGPSQYFGGSIALDGDTVVVTSPFDDDHGVDSGSAYVFTRSGTDWDEQAKLVPTDGAEGDAFGENVALEGDVALVGTIFDDDQGEDAGSVYVFTRAAGVWSQRPKIHASDGAAGDAFGVQVDIDGGSVLVGANRDDDQGEWSGSAYVFTLDRTCVGDPAGAVAVDTLRGLGADPDAAIESLLCEW